MANEGVPYYETDRRVTGKATGAITGKRCVMISGNKTTDIDANLQIAHATAAGRIFGVSAADCAIGGKVTVYRREIVPITAAGTIAAFAEVEVGTNGQVVTKAAGVAIGYACTGATSGNDAMIALY